MIKVALLINYYLVEQSLRPSLQMFSGTLHRTSTPVRRYSGSLLISKMFLVATFLFIITFFSQQLQLYSSVETVLLTACNFLAPRRQQDTKQNLPINILLSCLIENISRQVITDVNKTMENYVN